MTVTAQLPLRFASSVPPQTTSVVPLRVAVTIASPLTLQVRQRLAVRIVPRTSSHAGPQVPFPFTTRIDPQIPAGKASGQTFRTTPGTVPGTVPRANRKASLSTTCEEMVLITRCEIVSYGEVSKENENS